MLSWFHLTLDSNSAIVRFPFAPRARARRRLFKIAERVDEPAHALAKNLSDVADAISHLFIALATAFYKAVKSAIPTLYPPGQPAERDIRKIMTQLSIFTPRGLKAGEVRAS